MAAVKFIADINLSNNQLTNVKLQNLTSDPSGLAGEGQIYYDSNANVIKFHTGSDNWVSLSSASGDITAVVAGNGLTGGANSGSATLTVGAGAGITVNTGDVAVTAANTNITSLTNAALTLGRDTHNLIDFGTDNQIKFTVSTNQAITFKASGEIEATKFDGALEGNADTASVAAVATLVTITDNESTDENNPIVFVAGGDVDGGNLGLETDGTAHYNPSSGKITATAFAGALTGDVTGNADTVTTNANLTGHITSSGNAAVLGSFTVAQLSAALSNASISGNNTGDQTTVSGSSGTVTSIGNLTGDVTSSNRATTIAAAAVHHSMLHDDIISGQGDLGANLASTDEFLVSDVSDSGTVKRMDASRLTTFLQSALTFTTNTDADVSVANLKTALAGGFGSNAVTIGDSNDVVTIGNDLTVTGDLLVSGDTVTVNTATLSVEDPLIKLASGNSADSVDTGFYNKYVESSTTKYAGLFRDVSATGNPFTFFDGNQAEPGTTVNTSGTGYDLADVSAGKITAADGFVGNVTGNASGSAGSCTGAAATVTSIGNLTGDITSSNRATTIASGAVHHAMLNDDIISGQAALTALAQDDIFMVHDTSASAVKKITYTNLEDDIFGNISEHVTVAAGGAATIANGVVSLAMQANLAADKIIGRANGAGTGVPTALSATQIRTIINVENGATADQSTGDIDGLAITTVGTLDTGNATGIVDTALVNRAGKVELATTAEALAGSDTARAVTPAGLAARSYRAAMGDGSATAFNIDHGLATRDVIVQLYDASSYETVYAQVVRTTTARVVVTFNSAPASNDIIVLVTKVD
jgi:hypothetical protein